MQIGRVTLASRNLEAQRHFYGEVLGLPSTMTPEGALQVLVGSSQLLFRLDESVQPFYHIAFNIPTNQIEAAVAWADGRFELLPSGGQVISHSTSWNSDGYYFYDPDGNIMELIARHTLANATEAPFGPEQILCVSEVGLPVADVPGTVDLFAAKLALPEYDCNRVSFNAMGDEQGLFIVVIEGRNWFPTQTPAKPLPVTIELRTAIAEPVTLEGPGYQILAKPL